jgi:hypothetical protein
MFHKRGSLESILGLLARSARNTFQSWVNGTLEQTARPALRWILAMEISYLIAGGSAIIAAAFVLAAVASGLALLGLPAWAGQLIVAAVAGVVALIFYHRGKTRRLQDELDDDEAPRGWRIRVVKGATSRERRPAPRPRTRRGGTFDVHPSQEGWEVTSRSPRVKESFETKEEALSEARRRASKAEQARVVVHGSSGAIQDVLRYGNGRT